jgi:hypothetical protein
MNGKKEVQRVAHEATIQFDEDDNDEVIMFKRNKTMRRIIDNPT